MARNVSKPQTEAGQQHDRARDMGPFGPDFREPTQKELQMPGDRPFMVERPLPEDRWPRGYTPGRKREVEAALPDVSFGAIAEGGSLPKEYFDAALTSMNRDVATETRAYRRRVWDAARKTSSTPSSTPSSPDHRAVDRDALDYAELARSDFHRVIQDANMNKEVLYAEPILSVRARLALQALAKSNTVDILSRSAISPTHIRGTGSAYNEYGAIKGVTADNGASRQNISPMLRAASSGMYMPRSNEVHLRYPTRSNSSQRVALHEFGHANDPSLASIPKANGEGFAEGFAYHRLRIDPRDTSNIHPSTYLGGYDKGTISEEEKEERDVRTSTIDPRTYWGHATPVFIQGYLRGHQDVPSEAPSLDQLHDWHHAGPYFMDDEDSATDVQTAPPKRSRQDFEVMQLPGLEDDSSSPRVSIAMQGPQFVKPAHQSTVNPLKGYVDPTLI